MLDDARLVLRRFLLRKNPGTSRCTATCFVSSTRKGIAAESGMCSANDRQSPR